MSLDSVFLDSFCSPSSDGPQDPVAEAWQLQLLDRINVYNGTTDKYIRTFVPSRARCSFSTDGNAFSKWEPVPGKETDSYPGLIEGLNRLVAPFPEDKRLSFIACDKWKMTFPFQAFAHFHHETSLDMVASLPGVVFDPEVEPNWRQIAIVLEGQSTGADPFENNDLSSCKRLTQMAVNARNLVHAHGLLAVFAVGVYGDIVRIARFDHACAVASKRLSLRKFKDLKLLQRFFWRFVNPCHDAVPFVGCDPTIRPLTPCDEEWLNSRLLRAGVDPTQVIVSEARWAEVYDDDCEDEEVAAVEPKPYIMFKAIDVNGRLFSRATSVWLSVRDTRQDVDGELVDIEYDASPVPLRIIKDSWRELFREPEITFYDHLDVIEDDERVGLAKLLCGGDLGEREVRLWENALYVAPVEDIDHTSRLNFARTSTNEHATATAPRSMTFYARATGPPPHRPMQQTFSWRLSRGKRFWYRERSHIRFVVDTVGRPLTRFKSTKELVQAVFDACRGHRLAFEKAGILHRDVSVGNILIVDKPGTATTKFHGFLHDFDSSSVEADKPTEDTAQSEIETDYAGSDSDDDQIGGPGASSDAGPDLKKRTGTYYFMAVELLSRKHCTHEIWHDLESFYWVLLWVVLRHTAHKHPLKERAADDIFKYGDDSHAYGAKKMWLDQSGHEKFFIVKNRPLTHLLESFRALVLLSSSGLPGVERLSYDAVEAIFEEALKSEEWPENDFARKYIVPETPKCTVSEEVKPKRQTKKRGAADAGSKPASATGLTRKAQPAGEDAAPPPRVAPKRSKRN